MTQALTTISSKVYELATLAAGSAITFAILIAAFDFVTRGLVI